MLWGYRPEIAPLPWRRVASSDMVFSVMGPQDELAEGQKVVGKLRYGFWAKAGYGLIVAEGVAETVPVTTAFHRDIEIFLRSSGLTRVVWDSRRIEPPPPAVRAYNWAWFEHTDLINAAAIVVNSELLRVSGNMRSLSRHLRLRSFNDSDEAVRWLLQQPA